MMLLMSKGGGYLTPDVDEIKDALRRCETVQQVNECARHYGPAVARFKKSKDLDMRVMALHIANLAGYRRLAITEGFKT